MKENKYTKKPKKNKERKPKTAEGKATEVKSIPPAMNLSLIYYFISRICSSIANLTEVR